LAVNNLTGGTGSLQNLAVKNLTRVTGSFQNLAVNNLTGGTGSFNYLAVNNLTGGNGSFQNLAVNNLTGGTGSINYLAVNNLTGGTGSFDNLAVNTLVGGNGYFNTFYANTYQNLPYVTLPTNYVGYNESTTVDISELSGTTFYITNVYSTANLTLTINLPSNPADGTTYNFVFSIANNTVILNAQSTQSIAAKTGVNAPSLYVYTYFLFFTYYFSGYATFTITFVADANLWCISAVYFDNNNTTTLSFVAT
jgi:hypothetical protein